MNRRRIDSGGNINQRKLNILMCPRRWRKAERSILDHQNTETKDEMTDIQDEVEK